MDGRKRALLVEDEEFISFLYKRQLDLAGIPTDVADTMKVCFDLLSKNKYDVLLLDMMLPDSDGIEILESIRKNPQLLHLPVIIMTNLSQESVIEDAKKLGVIHYLIKSQITPDVVVKKVHETLHQVAHATPAKPESSDPSSSSTPPTQPQQ